MADGAVGNGGRTGVAVAVLASDTGVARAGNIAVGVAGNAAGLGGGAAVGTVGVGAALATCAAVGVAVGAALVAGAAAIGAGDAAAARAGRVALTVGLPLPLVLAVEASIAAAGRHLASLSGALHAALGGALARLAVVGKGSAGNGQQQGAKQNGLVHGVVP